MMAMRTIENFQLRDSNTFGMEATASFLVEPSSVEEVEAAVGFAGGRRMLVLGGGSNILFACRHFDGVVIRPSMKKICIVSVSDGKVNVKAEAGVIWDDLVKFAVDRGWGGLENLSGIPGTVGASPVQNIGAYGSEAGDRITEVEYFDTVRRRMCSIPSSECRFGYRDSVFKRSLAGVAVITSVTFSLDLVPETDCSYADLSSSVVSAGKSGIQDVRKAVLEIRASKIPDPSVLGNAGSFFKNPVIGEDSFRKLSRRFPDVRYFDLGNGMYKIPAAWLIDRSGLKGFTMGPVAVNERQPLVLTARSGATGQDVLALADHVVSTVREKTGMTIVPEVNVIE